MGISNACAVGERAVQISWVVRTRGFSARITALPVLHTRDPELVRLRAVTLRRIWPLALSCALHCLSSRLDIRWTVEKSSCPIRNHQFSLRMAPAIRSDTDSSNGFIWNKVSQFISDAFAMYRILYVVMLERHAQYCFCRLYQEIQQSIFFF